MTRDGFLVTAVTMIALPLWQAQASAKTPITLADEARATLGRVQIEASELAAHADEFRFMINDPNLDRTAPFEKLADMKDDINTIGREIQMTDSERAALPSWEQQAIDETMRLLKDSAANTESEIKYFNANTPDLWSVPQYRTSADRIWRDSDQMAKSLKSYLELARVRTKEQRLNDSLSQAGGSN